MLGIGRREAPSRAAWLAAAILVCAALISAACDGERPRGDRLAESDPEGGGGPTTTASAAGATSGSETGTLREDGVLFVRQGGGSGWTSAMTALARGELVVDAEGCLRLGPGGDMLVWPAGFRPSVAGNRVRVLDGDGQVVAQAGERVEVSGGKVSASGAESPQAFEKTRQRAGIPEECPGPFFVVGTEVRVVARK